MSPQTLTPTILLTTKRLASHVLGAAAHLLWPARCSACGAYVGESLAFCETCVVSLLPLGTACRGCALPLDRAGGCRVCRDAAFPFLGASAVFVYGGAIADAILRLKHGRRRELGRCLGHLLAPRVQSAIDLGIDHVLPVPLHPRRFRRRGFNQSLELARAARRGAKGVSVLLVDELARVVDTPSLGHETPSTRRRLVAEAFAVRRPARIAGRRLLLVDDVMTTGATAAGCALALLRAGAREVHVLALARAT